jgi:hypothetical protein
MLIVRTAVAVPRPTPMKLGALSKIGAIDRFYTINSERAEAALFPNLSYS